MPKETMMKKIEKYCLVLAKYYLELLALVKYCSELIQTNHCVKYRNSTWLPGVENLCRGTMRKLCGNCAFPQNFHTRNLDGITAFYAVDPNNQY